ncbi:MAG TPA: site-specific integrase [Steroidobacteraceae bacterium]|jgi:integrase|nr:site-specific integrase [Steroidobacteraceae bacterium]
MLSPENSLLPWSDTGPLLPHENRERLSRWEQEARNAYPPNTLRAWRADWVIYDAWARRCNLSPIPAAPELIAAYVRESAAAKKPATVRRYLATIARAHLAAGLVNPCASEPVRLAVKAMTRAQSVRQRQAHALGWAEISKFIETSGEGLRAERERALLCVAYDSMARRSELVALDIEDLTLLEDGTGRVLIRRSKVDQGGEGAVAYLACETVRHLQRWLERAGIHSGALFRRLIGRERVGARLHADQIADIYKRVASWVGMQAEDVRQVSGHSIRVGATQDLLALNIDLASVMQAGRWKSTAMPMRYGERVLASQNGRAGAAQRQSRDE